MTSQRPIYILLRRLLLVALLSSLFVYNVGEFSFSAESANVQINSIELQSDPDDPHEEILASIKSPGLAAFSESRLKKPSLDPPSTEGPYDGSVATILRSLANRYIAGHRFPILHIATRSWRAPPAI